MYSDLTQSVLGLLKDTEATEGKTVYETPVDNSAGITADMITKIAPTANADIVQGIVDNQGVLKKYGIDTPDRVGMFLAQTAHESDGFKTMNEYASGAAYEGRADLGNVNEGDGVRYKGRGLIQLTGRYNYEKYGSELGLNLVDNPEQAANVGTALELAAAYWKDKNLNELADAKDLESVTKKINGGYNGLENRRSYYDRASNLLTNVQVGNNLVKPAALGFGEATTSLETNKGAPDTELLAKDDAFGDTYAQNTNELLSALPNYQNINTFSEAFNAFYNSELGHTQAGLDTLSIQSARDANEKNLAYLEGRVSKEEIEALKIAVPGNALSEAYSKISGLGPIPTKSIGDSLRDFDKAVSDFNERHPDLKLPVSSSSDIYSTVNSQMMQYDKEYADINTGGWFDSQASFFRNLGVVLGAYGGAGLAIMAQDPETAATNAAYVGLSATGVGLVPAAAAFLGLESLRETGVQLRRQGMGQDAPISEGLGRAAISTGGMLAFDGAVRGLGKLWKYGSKEADKVFAQVVKAADEAEKANLNLSESSSFQYAKNVDELAKNYKTNPYGNNMEAKVKLEASIDAAYKDVLSGKPVREFDATPLKMAKSDKVEAAKFGAYVTEPDVADVFKASLNDSFRMWDDVKYGSVKTPVYSGPEQINTSLIPILKAEGTLHEFPDIPSAQKFLGTKEGRALLAEDDVHIFSQSDGRAVLLKSADLEPANQPSSRISSSTPEELVTRRVGSEDVVALKSSEADLAIAERFPEQSFVRPLNHEAMSDPLGYRLNGKQVEYPKPFREAGDTAVTDELNYYKEVSDAEMSKEFDAALNRLESFTPNKELDVGPGLGADAAERVKIKDEIASIKEEKSAWQALKSCLVGN